MDDQRKDHIDPEGPTHWNRPRQLQTHNLPTDDVEKINITKKGRDLLLANKTQIVPWGNRKDAAKDPEAQESYFTKISTS